MFIPVGIVWLICYGRHTDIDNLILNTMGVAIGALIVFAIRKVKR